MPNQPLSYRDGKQRLKSIRWMLFRITLIQSVVALLVNLVASFLPSDPPFWISLLLVELFAYLLPLGIYAGENRILSAQTAREGFGLKPCRKNLWWYVLLMGLGCQFVMLLLNLPVNLLLNQSESASFRHLPDLLAAFLVVGIIPAVFEEFLFRGIVYGVMKEFNSKAALIFTTVLFALMHGSVTGFLGYLFLGALAVLILRRTRSVYACMGFHLINNIVAILLSYFSEYLLSNPSGTRWLFGAGIVAVILGVWGLKASAKPEPETNRTPLGELLGQSFLSIPILLCILCVAGLLIFG